MSVNSQMTALATAIRNVTGKPGLLSLEAMTAEVNGFLEQTPDYIVEEAVRVAELVNWRDPNTFVMVCGSDMHLYAGNSAHDNSFLSAKYAGMGIRELSKRMHIDAVAMLGDYSWMASSDYTAAQTMQDITLFHRTAKLDEAAEIWSVGNHDLCYGDGVDRSLTLEELHEYIGSYGDDVKSADNPLRCYGYLDFPTQKIRVINLDTCTPESMTDGKWASQDVITDAQQKWLSEVALDFSDKEKASDWGVVIVGHHPIHYAVNYFRRVLEILEAYRGKKTSVTPYYTSNTYTFADDPNDRAEIICNIHGHNHNCGYSQVSSSFPTIVQYDANGNMTTEPTVPAWLWRFSVPNMCAGRYNTPIASTNASFKYKYGEFDENGDPVYWKKETGTAKATSFVVFAIDRTNKKVNAYIFGAGKNRTAAYDGTYVPAVYTITTTLSNVSAASGNPATVTEFQTASLTFTANNGYELPDSVTVNGADYTWNKATGVLTLSNPIGNVSVTIEAVALPSYTNQIPISTDTDGSVYNGKGWKENTRLETSGATGNRTGIATTGFMPIGVGSANSARGEQVIYLANTEVGFTADTRLTFYTADKTFMGLLYGTQFKAEADDDGGVYAIYTSAADGYVNKLDVTGITSYYRNASKGEAAFFRVGAPGIDGDSIITVNEPIV